METDPHEKQFQMWHRFMYMALGASSTFVVISFGKFINPTGWPSFANYASGPWLVLQLLTTPPGFYLLWSSRRRTRPLRSRVNTISGYLMASWFNLLAFALMTQEEPPTESSFLLVCGAVAVPLVCVWILKKPLKLRDEIFP
jgi:hypothetical protein